MSEQPQYTLIGEITGTYNKCPYKWLFEKYKSDCKIFFETGTYIGDSLKAALELGYEKVLSVEEDPLMYKKAQENLKDLPSNLQEKIHLFLGNSGVKVPEMLAMVDSRALFWIDAHYASGEGAFIELKHIKNHHIKNHIIIVDDIPLYFGDGSEVKTAILDINPDYKFTFETFAPRGPNYHLVAHF